MTLALPVDPDLGWLKKTAKQRLASARRRGAATHLYEAQADLARSDP